MRLVPETRPAARAGIEPDNATPALPESNRLRRRTERDVSRERRREVEEKRKLDGIMVTSKMKSAARQLTKNGNYLNELKI